MPFNHFLYLRAGQLHSTITRWLATQFGANTFPETIFNEIRNVFNQILSRWWWCRLQGDSDPWKGGDGWAENREADLSGLNLNRDGVKSFLLMSRSSLLLGDPAKVWKSESVKVWKGKISWPWGRGWQGAWSRGCQWPPSSPFASCWWLPRPLRRSSDQATMS